MQIPVTFWLERPVRAVISYCNADGKLSERRITIRGLGCNGNHGIRVEAWCSHEKRRRSFDASKIRAYVDDRGHRSKGEAVAADLVDLVPEPARRSLETH